MFAIFQFVVMFQLLTSSVIGPSENIQMATDSDGLVSYVKAGRRIPLGRTVESRQLQSGEQKYLSNDDVLVDRIQKSTGSKERLVLLCTITRNAARPHKLLLIKKSQDDQSKLLLEKSFLSEPRAYLEDVNGDGKVDFAIESTEEVLISPRMELSIWTIAEPAPRPIPLDHLRKSKLSGSRSGISLSLGNFPLGDYSIIASESRVEHGAEITLETTYRWDPTKDMYLPTTSTRTTQYVKTSGGSLAAPR